MSRWRCSGFTLARRRSGWSSTSATRRQRAIPGGERRMSNTFTVALTGDFYDAAGRAKYDDLGLGVFEGHSNIKVKSFSEHRKQIGRDQIEGASGVIVLTPAVTRETVTNAEDLLAI